MANEKNLIPNSERSPNEVRENGKKGGIASGEARRNKKLLRECLEILLEKEMKGKNGETITGAEALTTKLFAEAMKGNVKAFEVIRDTAGQKPVEKIVVSEIDNDVVEEIERMVNNDEGTSG